MTLPTVPPPDERFFRVFPGVAPPPQLTEVVRILSLPTKEFKCFSEEADAWLKAARRAKAAAKQDGAGGKKSKSGGVGRGKHGHGHSSTRAAPAPLPPSPMSEEEGSKVDVPSIRHTMTR
jgi:hypothetical protein